LSSSFARFERWSRMKGVTAMTTDELRQSIALRVKALRDRLNEPQADPVEAAVEARRLFGDAVDETRVRWLELEQGGYRDLLAVRPLHEVLGVPAGDRLAAHVGAYRTQRGFDTSPGHGLREFSHFFVEPLPELLSARDRVRRSAATSGLELSFGAHASMPDYPTSGEFARDVFERILAGFLAALQLQLGAPGP
jgi:hypothetical protein